MQFKYVEPADSNLFPDERIKKQIELDFLLKFDTLITHWRTLPLLSSTINSNSGWNSV